jgi:hypothetical protein
MSDLPDVYVEPDGNDHTVVANQKARRFLNKNFYGGRPRWGKVTGGFASPEYRALRLKDSAAVAAAMLFTSYEAGLRTMFVCTDCHELHLVDNANAKHLRAAAMAGSVTALPAHETVQ